MFHPRKNEQGGAVKLKSPSTATPTSTWAESGAIARVVPDGKMPTQVNGLEIGQWAETPTSIATWEALASTMPIDEPPFNAPAGYTKAAGVVVCEPDGRVWVVAPSNGWAGYDATFPKGTMDGKSTKATALVEAFEESGLAVRLTKFLIDVKRSASYTRYFLGERMGGNPANMGWESQAVMLVPRDQLAKIVGHQNDAVILHALAQMDRARPKVADFLKSWTLNSVTRLLVTATQYRARYGEWPMGMRLNAGMATAIQAEVLTPLAWSKLIQKMELISINEGTVIGIGDDGKEVEYGDHSSQKPEDLRAASEWIWGVDLTLIRQ